MTYDTSAEYHQVAPASVPPAGAYPPPNPGYAAGPYTTEQYPAQPYAAQQAQPYPAQPYAAQQAQPYVAQPYPGQQAQPYPAPAYGFGPHPQTILVQPASHPGRGLSITALVIGIVAAVLFWVPGLDLVLALIATVFGAVGMGIAVRRNGPKGMAIAGLVLGVLVLAWSVLWWAALAAAISGA